MATTAARRRQSATRIPDIDPKSAAGLALTEAVQSKLRQFLGADYTDRSLAQVRARVCMGMRMAAERSHGRVFVSRSKQSTGGRRAASLRRCWCGPPVPMAAALPLPSPPLFSVRGGHAGAQDGAGGPW